MSTAPADLSPAALDFVTARHLATLTTLRPDGSPHVVPVGFTWDPEALVVRVITSGPSRKARNAAAGGRAVVCQVDGRYWLSFEGTARVLTDPASVADAVRPVCRPLPRAAREPGARGRRDHRRPGARQRLAGASNR